MDKLLDVVNCPDNLKVKLASFYLEGAASMWWTPIKEAAKRPDFTWEMFIAKLKEKSFRLRYKGKRRANSCT